MMLLRTVLLLGILLPTAAMAERVAPETATAAPLTVSAFKQALPDENARELDLEGFAALQQQQGTVVIDVRSKESFDAEHIKGSINAPLTDLTEKTLPALAPDTAAPVVLVCHDSFGPTRRVSATMQAYPVLKAAGYSQIYRLNLWQGRDNTMRSPDDIAKQVPFEGTQVKTAP